MKQLHLNFSGGRPLPVVEKSKPAEIEARPIGEIIDDMGSIVAFAKAAPQSFWDGMKLDD